MVTAKTFELLKIHIQASQSKNQIVFDMCKRQVGCRLQNMKKTRYLGERKADK